MYSKKRIETDAHLYRLAEATKLLRMYEKLSEQEFEHWLSAQPKPIKPDREDFEKVQKEWPRK